MYFITKVAIFGASADTPHSAITFYCKNRAVTKSGVKGVVSQKTHQQPSVQLSPTCIKLYSRMLTCKES